MGILDRAKDLIGKHDEKIDETAEKIGDVIDDKTGGRFGEQIDKAVDAVQENTGEGDTTAR